MPTPYIQEEDWSGLVRFQQLEQFIKDWIRFFFKAAPFFFFFFLCDVEVVVVVMRSAGMKMHMGED